MNKLEIIEHIATSTGLSKADAGRSLDSFISAVVDSLKKDQKVTLVGFGTFRLSKRKARTGRNPQTGAVINIPASNVPVFRAGKEFKEQVQEK